MNLKRIIAIITILAVSTTVMAAEPYVPLRLTAYTHGAAVEWDGYDRSVHLTFADGSTRVVAVEEVGGFIEDGTSWIPAAYAAALFPAVQENRPQIHGMLTRIEYGGNTAYIFGSVHAGHSYWFPLHPMVEDAMASADVFGFEVDMSQIVELSEEYQMKLVALQTLPDGLTLEDILPEDVFENFIAAFETFALFELEYELIAHLTPVAVSMLIELLMSSLVSGAELGVVELMVDGYITNFALENNRPIIGFENIVEQAYLVLDIPLEMQIYALADFPDFETLYNRTRENDIMDAYARQDMDAIRAILYSGWQVCGNPLEQRNRYVMWDYRCRIYANGIAELLRDTAEPTTFFFTFGLSHIMGGNAGIVLELLADMGFDVVPLWR